MPEMPRQDGDHCPHLATRGRWQDPGPLFGSQNDPEPLGDGVTLAYDVTGEPIGDWVVGTDPEPQGYERVHR